MVGRQLLYCRIQVISPQINVVYLGFNDAAFAIQGDIGGEVLKVVPISSAPEAAVFDVDSGTAVREYQGATLFLGRRVAQARVVGETWNGHGVELAFEGLPDQTLVISSVEAEENNTGLHDALRIGTLKYTMTCDEDA